jgi:ribosomal protein S27AE
MTELWQCDHERTRLVNRVISNGVLTAWHQCQRCGKGVRAVKRDSAEIATWQAQNGLLGEWSEEIRINWEAGRERLWRQQQAEREMEKRRNDADWRRRYLDHLDSPAWWDRRKLVLKRAGNMCEGCGVVMAAEVHHLTYEHMGDEFLFELVALCRACHARYHGLGA